MRAMIDKIQVLISVNEPTNAVKTYENLLTEFGHDSTLAQYLNKLFWNYKFTECPGTFNITRKYYNLWKNEIKSGKIPRENFEVLAQKYYNLLNKVQESNFIKHELPILFNNGVFNPYFIHLAAKYNSYLGGSESLYTKYPFVYEFLTLYADSLSNPKYLLKNTQYYTAAADSDTSNFTYNLLAAELNFRASHFKNALRLYKRVLKQKPGWRKIIIRTAELAHSLGDTSLAIELYKKLITLEPQNRKYVERLGDILEQSGYSADTIWQYIIYDDPLSTESWGEYAAVCWDYLRYDEGIEIIKSARQFFGNPNLFAKELGALYDWQGKYDDAFEEYLRALTGADYWEVSQILDWMKKLARHQGESDRLLAKIEKYINPKTPSGAFISAYAQLCFEQGDTQRFISKIKNIAESAENEDVLQQIINYAQQLDQKDIEIAAYIRLGKVSGEAYYLVNAAEICLGAKDTARAKQIWKDIIKIDESYLPGYASFLAEIGEHKLSAQIYEKLIESEPEKWEYYPRLARQYIALGERKKSRKLLENIIEKLKSKKDYNTKRAIKQLRIALAETYIGEEPHSALAAYERLINKYPTDYTILRRAWLFARKHKLVPELIKYYEDVAKKSFKNYRWDLVLWNLYRWEHRSDMAKKYLLLACDNEPQRLPLWRMRFSYDIVNGDLADARKCLAQMEKLGAETDDLKITYYLLTDNPDSAYEILAKPAIKNQLSSYGYRNLISELINRGMFDRAKQVLSLWKSRGGKEFDLSDYYELLSKLYEVKIDPESAFGALNDHLGAAMENKSYSWEIEFAIDQIVDFAENWHYISHLIRSDKNLNPGSRWAKYTLKQLYIRGGAPVKLARLLLEDAPDSAIKLLYNADEYASLAKWFNIQDPFEYFADHPDLFIKYATALGKTGKPAYARRLLNSAMEFSPNNPYTALKISRAFAELGEWRPAEKFLKLATTLKKYPDSRFRRAEIEILLAKGDTAAAVKKLFQTGKRPEIWQIEKLFEMGRDDLALNLVRKLWLYEDTRSEYDYYDYYYWDAVGDVENLLISHGKTDVVVKRLLERAAKSEDEWFKNELLVRAAELCIESNPGRAAEIVRTHFGAEPDDPDAAQILGKAYLKLGKYDRAIALFEKLNPQYTDGKILLAEAYYKSGDTLAGDDILTGIAEDDLSASTMSKVISALAENRRGRLAARFAALGLKLWGGTPGIWLSAAKAYSAAGDYKNARKYAEMSMFYHGENNVSDEAIDFWAKKCAKSGYKSYYNSAKSKINSPNTPEHEKFDLIKFCAKYNWHSGNRENAIKFAEKLISQFPWDRNAYDFYASILKSAGKEREFRRIKHYIKTHFEALWEYEWSG